MWAEALRSDRMADLYPLPDGYPIAPHALMAALAAVSGIAMDEVLNGLLIATAALTALAAWPLLARLPVAARVAGAVLVAFAYLPAAYFGQGAFKETMFALLIVAFAAVLAEARGARRPWIEAGVPAGLIAAGGVQVYSYLALGWFGAIAVAWLVLELALGGPRDVGARVRGALPAVGPAIAAAGAVLVVGLAAQVDRLASFANVFSVSPAGAGGGIGVTDLGNLAGKLSAYEGLGVWPSPDFRFAPGNAFHAGELAAVALVVVVVGTVVALRRREAALVGAAAAVLAIYWVSDRTQSPYVAAKALVLAAPLVMALALAAWPSERRGWMDGTLARMALVGVFALGAAYSSSLALRAAPVASQEQERELDALRPLVGNERTLFLGSDDHIAWLLRGVNVGSPQISAQRTAIAVPPARREAADHQSAVRLRLDRRADSRQLRVRDRAALGLRLRAAAQLHARPLRSPVRAVAAHGRHAAAGDDRAGRRTGRAARLPALGGARDQPRRRIGDRLGRRAPDRQGRAADRARRRRRPLHPSHARALGALAAVHEHGAGARGLAPRELEPAREHGAPGALLRAR